MTAWVCMTRPFRDNWIGALKSDDYMQITDGTIPGFYMRYSPRTQAKTFYLACKIKHSMKRRNIFLGKYGELRLGEYREMALDYRRQIIKGQDPVYDQEKENKQREKESAKRVKVSVLFNDYIAKYARLHKKPSSVAANEVQIRLYINPQLGDKYITEIEDKHLADAYSCWAQTVYDYAQRSNR